MLSLKIVTLTKKKVLAHVFQAYGTLWWKYRLELCHFTNFVPVIFLSRESITFSVCIYFSFELWIDFLFKSSSPHQSRLLISPWQTIGPDHVTLGNTSTPHTKKYTLYVPFAGLYVDVWKKKMSAMTIVWGIFMWGWWCPKAFKIMF